MQESFLKYEIEAMSFQDAHGLSKFFLEKTSMLDVFNSLHPKHDAFLDFTHAQSSAKLFKL